MQFNFQKSVGWLLLLLGLLVIFYGIYSSYNIFIGKNEAPMTIMKVGEKNNENANKVSDNLVNPTQDKNKKSPATLELPKELTDNLSSEQMAQLKNLDLGGGLEQIMGGGGMEQLLGDSLNQILPMEAMAKTFNLGAWSIFMGILFWGGGAIASLGIKLLKNDDKKS